MPQSQAARYNGDPDRGNTGSIKDFLLGTVAGILESTGAAQRFGLIAPQANQQDSPERRAPVFTPMATVVVAGATGLLAAGAIYLLTRKRRG